MQNIIEYVENNMKTFAASEFNAVDSLVLSKLSYVRFENIVPFLSDKGRPVKMGELLKAELFASMFPDKRDSESVRRLLYALAASPRFRNIHLNFYTNNYDPVSEKQFSAVTFLLEDESAYIAYRGTDSSFVGWKEDFNMAYMSPIPAQEDGVKYLNTVARKVPRVTLRVGGIPREAILRFILLLNAIRAFKNVLNVYTIMTARASRKTFLRALSFSG